MKAREPDRVGTHAGKIIQTKGKKFSVKIKYKQGWACKKYRNEERMKTREDYAAAEESW